VWYEAPLEMNEGIPWGAKGTIDSTVTVPLIGPIQRTLKLFFLTVSTKSHIRVLVMLSVTGSSAQFYTMQTQLTIYTYYPPKYTFRYIKKQNASI
jgi:hypothetical protein